MIEASIAKIYIKLMNDKISQESFVQKKNVINNAIERKREVIAGLTEELRIISEGRESVESAVIELTPLLAIETLDRELVDSVIDKVLVYGENEIEIVWAG